MKRFKLFYRSIRWMQVFHYSRLYGLGKRFLDFNKNNLLTSRHFLLPDMSLTIPKRVNSLPITTRLIDFVGSVSSILCRQLQLRLRSFRLYLLQGPRKTHRVDAGLDNFPGPKVIYAVRFFSDAITFSLSRMNWNDACSDFFHCEIVCSPLAWIFAIFSSLPRKSPYLPSSPLGWSNGYWSNRS